jgi:hypothetical protein
MAAAAARAVKKGTPRVRELCFSNPSATPYTGLAERAIGKSAAKSDRFAGARRGTVAADHRQRHPFAPPP